MGDKCEGLQVKGGFTVCWEWRGIEMNQLLYADDTALVAGSGFLVDRCPGWDQVSWAGGQGFRGGNRCLGLVDRCPGLG